MDHYQSLTAKAQDFLSRHPKPEQITGDKLVMEPPEMVAVHSAKIKYDDGDYLKVNATTPEAQAEFDWTIEITTAADHYLLLKDGQIVRAVRKDLFPLDDAEAQALEQLLDRGLASIS